MSKKVYIFLADGFEEIEGLTVVFAGEDLKNYVIHLHYILLLIQVNMKHSLDF